MKQIITLTLVLLVFSLNAQTNPVQISPSIFLPKDSTESASLIGSLNDFLNAAQEANQSNEFIFEKEKIETFILLDEINGIEKSGRFNDNHFYKPYLTNIVLLKDGNYLMQLSYMGVHENIPYVRANFELIAHKANNSFLFSSPLLRNTKNWKVLNNGNHVFHYQYTINEKKVNEYMKLADSFDVKLKVPQKVTDYYLCDDVVALNKLFGVDYKIDYNGRLEGYSTSDFGDRKLVVLGTNNASFSNFDPHDLFHDRLSLVIERSKVNKPVDEGYAYLYGGSWGFSWKEIFKAFKDQIASDRGANWSEVKEKEVRFKTGDFTNSADYVVNALLVKKIEKEKGFAGVWELLNVGPAEKGNEKYYHVLERLTGITKATYNENVWKLIDAEK